MYIAIPECLGQLVSHNLMPYSNYTVCLQC